MAVVAAASLFLLLKYIYIYLFIYLSTAPPTTLSSSLFRSVYTRTSGKVNTRRKTTDNIQSTCYCIDTSQQRRQSTLIRRDTNSCPFIYLYKFLNINILRIHVLFSFVSINIKAMGKPLLVYLYEEQSGGRNRKRSMVTPKKRNISESYNKGPCIYIECR